MNFKEVQQLIEIVNVSTLDEVIIKEGQTEITLRRNIQKAQGVLQQSSAITQPVQSIPTLQQRPEQTAQIPQITVAPPANDLIDIHSPIVGTFYRSSSPDSLPFVTDGDKVKSGDILCIIEAMKLMNEIECEVSGTIAEILVDNGQPVEYNQVLFRIKP